MFFDRVWPFFQAKLKFMVLGLLLVLIAYIFYMFISGFLGRIHTVWETVFQTNIAEIMILADQKVDRAQMDVDLKCGAFSLSGNEESLGCGPAKARLAVAMQHKADVEAKKAVTMSMSGQIKMFYDGFVESIHQKPLPFAPLAGGSVVLLVFILISLRPFITDAIKRGGKSCLTSEDGLP
ncbi:MAG: hypothetical protein M0Z78_08725 [Betaproteobacteria bacterium]|nr:hypothetical protein [Betaproteobacteria bacterium]